MRILIVLGGIFLAGCDLIPEHYTSPKTIIIDGGIYTACAGIIRVYSPSRDIAKSSQMTYEITFTDDFGHDRDFKDVSSYTIQKTEVATYAMPAFLPGIFDTTYSNGGIIKRGATVFWGDKGEKGRAIYLGPGDWKAVSCDATF